MFKLFLNCFIRVYVESMCADDLKYILRFFYLFILVESIFVMVCFNVLFVYVVSIFGGIFVRVGFSWEFNLRDVLRWCDFVE